MIKKRKDIIKSLAIHAKDGYCFIPNSEGNKTISNENINIFDPLQINFIVIEDYLLTSIYPFNTN